MNKNLTFEKPVSSIKQIHEELAAQAARAFYIFYPQIRGTLSPQFSQAISNLLFDEKKEIRGTVSPKLAISTNKLIKNLSFSHFAELITIDDSLKRNTHLLNMLWQEWTISFLFLNINLNYPRRKICKNLLKQKYLKLESKLFGVEI
jgi:hypothetical protein